MLFPTINLLGIGFAFGLFHACEADHMVAVGALVSETKNVKRSSWLGVLWGLGHIATILGVGSALLIARYAFPPRLTTFFEFLVGVMLIVLGAGVVRRAVRDYAHGHSHHNDAHAHRSGRRSFIVGMVHGLAGTGALVVLALASAPSLALGWLFIAVFGGGLITGMLIITAALSAPFHFFSLRWERLRTIIPMLAGTLSIVFGVSIVFANISTF